MNFHIYIFLTVLIFASILIIFQLKNRNFFLFSSINRSWTHRFPVIWLAILIMFIMATTQIFSLLRLSCKHNFRVMFVCFLSYSLLWYCEQNSALEATRSCTKSEANYLHMWIRECINMKCSWWRGKTICDMAYGSREHSMEVAKDSWTAIFNCRPGKCCHRWRISEWQRRSTLQIINEVLAIASLRNFDLSLLGKPFESLFLRIIKGFREKSQEMQLRLKKKSRNYLLLCQRKNFTCHRVDTFLGSDENKFHNDENSQFVTTKRSFRF